MVLNNNIVGLSCFFHIKLNNYFHIQLINVCWGYSTYFFYGFTFVSTLYILHQYANFLGFINRRMILYIQARY